MQADRLPAASKLAGLVGQWPAGAGGTRGRCCTPILMRLVYPDPTLTMRQLVIDWGDSQPADVIQSRESTDYSIKCVG